VRLAFVAMMCFCVCGCPRVESVYEPASLRHIHATVCCDEPILVWPFTTTTTTTTTHTAATNHGMSLLLLLLAFTSQSGRRATRRRRHDLGARVHHGPRASGELMHPMLHSQPTEHELASLCCCLCSVGSI
jgi:hypothetical protein